MIISSIMKVMTKAILASLGVGIIVIGILTLLEYYFGTVKVFLGCLVSMPFVLAWCLITTNNKQSNNK